jgi:hypothetical protein
MVMNGRVPCVCGLLALEEQVLTQPPALDIATFRSMVEWLGQPTSAQDGRASCTQGMYSLPGCPTPRRCCRYPASPSKKVSLS